MHGDTTFLSASLQTGCDAESSPACFPKHVFQLACAHCRCCLAPLARAAPGANGAGLIAYTTTAGLRTMKRIVPSLSPPSSRASRYSSQVQ